MSDCCDPGVYRHLFNSKEAKRSVKGYRKKGLDPMAAAIVDFLSSEGVAGMELLEVGGGIGAIEIELFKHGLEKAINIELSAGYDETAAALAAEEGVTDRIQRRIGDFVEIQDEVQPADIVLANRVVCCYPFMERMMSAFVSKTGKYLALVYPREKWYVRSGLKIAELFLRIRGCGFRPYVHPVSEIERIAEEGGLHVRHRDSTAIWQAMVWERAA